MTDNKKDEKAVSIPTLIITVAISIALSSIILAVGLGTAYRLFLLIAGI